MKTTTPIKIQWRDKKAPLDTAITAQELIRSDALARARKHLSIEIGTKRAWHCARPWLPTSRIATSRPRAKQFRDGFWLTDDDITSRAEEAAQ